MIRDKYLAQQIIDLGVPIFGESMKNKNDSPHCLFDPRLLLSCHDTLTYIGQRMGKVAKEDCEGSAVIGMSTSGIAWAAVASIYSGRPMLYVRKKLEPNVSNKYIEGKLPEDKTLTLVDDLLFAGESKGEAIQILQDAECRVTDVMVVIDRQIQRVKDGPSLQDKWGVRLHTLTTMSEIVELMIETNVITQQQLKNLVEDYQKFERWDTPKFVRKEVNNG